jgi:hypothetical protein
MSSNKSLAARLLTRALRTRPAPPIRKPVGPVGGRIEELEDRVTPAFTPGDVFAASGTSPSPVYNVTAGGNLTGATPFATLPGNDFGQIAWSADLSTAYTTQYNTGRVLAITSAGAVSTLATGINGPMGLIRTSAGNLLVGSHNTGAVFDVTAGGDFSAATPFAFGLTAPAT